MLCEFCNKNKAWVKTHNDKWICQSCGITYHFCEICGSISEAADTNGDHQLHYEEECFK